MNFNGCVIRQDDEGTVSMDMSVYMNELEYMHVTRERRKQTSGKATEKEYKAYRSLVGSIIWAGNGSLPHAPYMGSSMQQREPYLRVQDLVEAEKMLKQAEDQTPVPILRKKIGRVKSIEVWTPSDVS